MEQKSHLAKSQKLINYLHGDSASERFQHRLHCVAVVMSGFTASETARIFEDSPRAVAYWVTRYKKDGVEGLIDDKSTGRPSRLTPLQVKQVAHFLRKSHEKSQSVNALALLEHIQNTFGVTYTIRQCWRILNKYK